MIRERAVDLDERLLRAEEGLAALRTRHDPARWARLVANGMAQDFSWEKSARLYVRAYQRAIENKGRLR